MQPLLPPPTSESFNDDHSSLDPVCQSQPAVSQQQPEWDAQSHNDWEALLRSPSTCSPYNIPANHSFSGNWHPPAALADPNFNFYANSYTSRGPEPSTSHAESNLVTHQAPSLGTPDSQTVAPAAHRFSVDPCQSQPELLRLQWDAQSHDGWEASLRSPSTWSTYNVPRNYSFSGTRHQVALPDPSSVYTDSYASPREPEPSTSHSKSGLVIHQAPSRMPSSRTIEFSARLLSVPRLNTSVPLHRFVPYRQSGRNLNARHHDLDRAIANYSATQTTSSLIPSDSNLDLAPGPSSGVAVTLPKSLPPGLPLRLGLDSLPRLLLESREHFKRAIFNCNDGFSMNASALRDQARGSLVTTFGQNNLDLIEWANSSAGTREVDKISQTQKFIRDEIKDCLGACCESIYGIWTAFSEMPEQDFMTFIKELTTEEEFLNGPIEVDGVTRIISFGNAAVCTSAKQLLYSGLRYEQYISPDLNLKPLLTFIGLVIAWVLSQHKSGTFVKLGFMLTSKGMTDLHEKLLARFESLTQAELKALTIRILTQKGVPPNI